MTTSPRVEPPEELRDRDGWHWLENQIPCDPPTITQYLWFWRKGVWLGGALERAPDELAQVGWRYVAPCLTPAEVAAERDAAVARTEALFTAAQLAQAWLTIIAGSGALTGGDAELAHGQARELAAALAAYRAASPEAKP